MPCRSVRWLAAGALLVALLSACDEPPPATPALPTSGSATASLHARTALLRPDQMTGYRRVEDVAVTPDSLAQQNGDPPSPPAAVRYAGLLDGARQTYDSPSGTAFGNVVSEAVVFDTPGDASRFVGEERVRRSQPPAGGQLTTLPSPPESGVSDLVLLQSTVPPPTPTQTAQVAYFALMRRGRVVVELQAGGEPATATVAQFSSLLDLQVGQLSTTG